VPQTRHQLTVAKLFTFTEFLAGQFKTLSTNVREYVFFRFFSDFKKHDFTFFETTYQKVIKSHQQKFSPQYDTKE